MCTCVGSNRSAGARNKSSDVSQALLVLAPTGRKKKGLLNKWSSALTARAEAAARAAGTTKNEGELGPIHESRIGTGE